MPALGDVVRFLDAALRTAEVPDYPQALNGLQTANRGDVQSIAGAVDFSSHTVSGAVRARADMLLVHHGMFWGGIQPICGPRYRQLSELLAHDIAVYASHLPLDVHPVLGNNALLAHRLGLQPSGGFARFETIDVGVSGTTDVPTALLIERTTEFARQHGGTVVVPASTLSPDRRTRAWAICTGAGASSATVREAAQRNIDTLIVGEGPHHTAVDARDRDIVVIYAGHYATETLGVRALLEELARAFSVTTTFIDAPTGL